jgi:hypothetical protein
MTANAPPRFRTADRLHGRAAFPPLPHGACA